MKIELIINYKGNRFKAKEVYLADFDKNNIMADLEDAVDNFITVFGDGDEAVAND